MMICWSLGNVKVFSNKYVDGIGADIREVLYKLLTTSYVDGT